MSNFDNKREKRDQSNESNSNIEIKRIKMNAATNNEAVQKAKPLKIKVSPAMLSRINNSKKFGNVVSGGNPLVAGI